MSENKNILLCGVGGQGTILASKILSYALVEAGYDVKMSEIHGMSQRGGSVTTQVRYGKKVYSPIIGQGSADILVSFEAMEAYRYLEILNPKGFAVVNDFHMENPENIIEKVKEKATTKVLNAAKIAADLGNPKAMNVVLLGALIKIMKLEELDWDAALAACVKPAFLELNKKALAAGMEAVA